MGLAGADRQHDPYRSQQQSSFWLRHLERREWWLWGTAVFVTLLLTLGILSFLPLFLQSGESSESIFLLKRAAWGLLAIVLLFDVHTVRQQIQMHRMRRGTAGPQRDRQKVRQSG